MLPNENKPIIIIELNEFNQALLNEATKQYSFPSIQKFLQFPMTQYTTEDREESGYLEPWVQWVSIHSGVGADQHRIQHLGDVPSLSFLQVWEILSQNHISCGVWGVMNGQRGQAENVPFFLPDPWTFSEWAQPSALNALLALPRYLAKNYQNLSKNAIFFKACKLMVFLLRLPFPFLFLKEVGFLLKALKKFGPKHFVFIGFFEIISARLFQHYLKKYRPDCSILFLNTLAHLQHHYWTAGTLGITPPILFGLQCIDKILQQLFFQFGEYAFVVHNGLSQMNTNHEKPWVLYRQKTPISFLKAIGVQATRVEALMTHDAHVFMDTAEQCAVAVDLLKSAHMKKKPLFLVEQDVQNPCKFFYRLAFTDQIEQSCLFYVNEKPYGFFQYFDKIVTRTGRHIPVGQIYSDTLVFPNDIKNHEFNQYLYHYFFPKKIKSHEKLEQSLQQCQELI